MKEERFRKKAKLYPLSDHLILFYLAKFLLLNSLSGFYFFIFFFFLIHYQQKTIHINGYIHYQAKLFVYNIIFFETRV